VQLKIEKYSGVASNLLFRINYAGIGAINEAIEVKRQGNKEVE